MIPDPMLPGGCSDSDDYFDVPNAPRSGRRMVKLPKPPETKMRWCLEGQHWYRVAAPEPYWKSLPPQACAEHEAKKAQEGDGGER